LVLYEPDAPPAPVFVPAVDNLSPKIIPPATRPSYSEDEAEKMVRPALVKAFADMTLGKSTLSELIPAVAVEAVDPNASWETLLAKADRLYPNDKPRRAVYLVQGLKDGDPANHLQDLGYPIPPGDSAGGNLPANIRHYFVIIPLPSGASRFGFAFTINTTSDRLNSSISFIVVDITVGGVVYSGLSFDEFNRLESFDRRINVNGGAMLEICGGNSDGSVRCDLYRYDSAGIEDLQIPSTHPGNSD
jgi:hypothetical protein